ncbi:unnamed protein product [Angiostrongylus costaricensis]|uniref:Amine oxidase n=1 Tax=Angiostrongylus costaricensis TaxID=334426 RepID=A0A0R3PFI0_ANGCS|nr:unnamed protein product [Angiostrongylus costaricensis]
MFVNNRLEPQLHTAQHVQIKENSRSNYFQGFLPSEIIGDQTLDQCFDKGRVDCVPRADVVLINFDNEPNDPWAIDQIDVDVSFILENSMEDRHDWHFEHSVLVPCISWMKGAHTYQIGPRNGLFIEHEFSYSPEIGGRIRDWV